ncbi:spermidine dicoumaroyl transferase [Salvia divinorum]|uniref:Spermidine dicoumaroyl transferase n=1 Tax=Salvia divinorum TaxID=28513 RepID=A0ABD1HAQ7_SALDI
MEFSVTTRAKGLVAPSEATPSGILELSVVDRLPALRCNARTLHVFRHGPAAVEVIREALAKALVPYYPLAGRLRVSDENELQIACTGDGIWVVDASADCTLDDVNYLDDAMSVPYEKLLPPPPPQTDDVDPLVQMQVTQFGCDGFVMGLIFCHSICDGLGAAQFLNAVGEMARGSPAPTTLPEWRRDFLPPSPSVPLPVSFPLPDHQLEPAIIDVSTEEIEKLKREFRQRSGKRCSTFEVVAAALWRRRTEVIALDEETEVKLVFFANCRNLVEPPLPEGFYGNCFFPVTVTATSREVVAKNVFEVVELIKEGKARLTEEFRKWAKKAGAETGPDPFAPPLEYRTLFISEWGRLGFMEVDYGWGNPVHVVPVQGSSVIPVGIVCSQPRPRTGARLMTWCVKKAHLPALPQRFHI